jgi:hypothetical protein
MDATAMVDGWYSTELIAANGRGGNLSVLAIRFGGEREEMWGEGPDQTFDRGEDALDGAEDDRPALVLTEPRREAADVGERGGGDHLPLERAQDEELHPQDGRAVELERVQPELRQPRRVVLLHFARQRQARHREQLQRPLLPPLNPSSPETITMHNQSIHQSIRDSRSRKKPAMAMAMAQWVMQVRQFVTYLH